MYSFLLRNRQNLDSVQTRDVVEGLVGSIHTAILESMTPVNRVMDQAGYIAVAWEVLGE
jgi:hypothetical protein